MAQRLAFESATININNIEVVKVSNIELVLVPKPQSDDTSHNDNVPYNPPSHSEISSPGEMSAVEVPDHSISQQAQYLEQQQNLIDQTNTQSSPLQSLHDINNTNWPQTITDQVLGVVLQNNP